jgi:membrane protease subunit (stomatin/prohibitin family)
MDELVDDKLVTEEENDRIVFDNRKIVEGLALPKGSSEYQVKHDSKLLLFKNYELLHEEGMGIYYLEGWSKVIASNKNKDFFMMFRINSRPVLIRKTKTKSPISFFDKKYGIVFDFHVFYNYSYDLIDSVLFIKNVVRFGKSYTFKELYGYIENALNNSILSFLSKILVSKNLSILECNSNSKMLSNEFHTFAKGNILQESGIELSDFNFTRIDFDENTEFEVINDALYEKADMSLRSYTYREKSRFKILSNRSKLKDGAE